MNEQANPAAAQPAAVEPVIRVFPDGKIVFGAGYAIGEILGALDVARQAVLRWVPVPARAAEPADDPGGAGKTGDA